MKRRILFIVVGIIAVILGVWYYFSNYTDTAILKNVLNRNGYSIELCKESVDLDFFIEPEWIPFDSDQPKKLNVTLYEVNNTEIILTEIWNRGNDIYFTFDTSYHLDYKTGEFLYNSRINEDGTFTLSEGRNDLVVSDSMNEPVILGQTGLGPGSSFSFGVPTEEINKIRDGFYVKYSGMKLYTYTLVD